MTIVLVRHGRTEANAGGLLLGRSDVALDAEGRRQAEALALSLPATVRAVARVVTSPLQRCRATAEAVARAVGAPLVVDDRWVELDYGELEGTPMAQVAPETWSAWQADVRWQPPGGESLADLGERVREACDGLVAEAPGGDVIVVSHVSPIKAAAAWALGVGDDVAWRMFVAPASITRVGAEGGRRSLRSFNETAHLG